MQEGMRRRFGLGLSPAAGRAEWRVFQERRVSKDAHRRVCSTGAEQSEARKASKALWAGRLSSTQKNTEP